DFTPTMFTDRAGASLRRTSDAFDLAMNVVFESGLQHLGVTPESLQRVPDYVRRYLAEVPVAWDETRFLDGWPGQFVVLARRKGARWYLGGINGGDEPRDVELDLGFVGAIRQGTLIADGRDARSFRREDIGPDARTLRVLVPGRGGFVAVLVPPGEG
ncbi:MAG TPA: glycoside hydrolase family 97 C-terminal domain-containing protein, partial [Longimicrobiales bacterium]|nr:glycoside hydrolase family 97 C-terminal domain-containing protein [Longimicrobiales bacterium]